MNTYLFKMNKCESCFLICFQPSCAPVYVSFISGLHQYSDLIIIQQRSHSPLQQLFCSFPFAAFCWCVLRFHSNDFSHFFSDSRRTVMSLSLCFLFLPSFPAPSPHFCLSINTSYFLLLSCPLCSAPSVVNGSCGALRGDESVCTHTPAGVMNVCGNLCYCACGYGVWASVCLRVHAQRSVMSLWL